MKERLLKEDDVNARMFPSVILNQVWKEARAVYKEDPQILKEIQTQLQARINFQLIRTIIGLWYILLLLRNLALAFPKTWVHSKEISNYIHNNHRQNFLLSVYQKNLLIC